MAEQAENPDPQNENPAGEEPPPPPPPKIKLTPEMIVSGLSQLARTFDGTSFAYGKLVAEEKELEVVGEDLLPYKDLRVLSLAKNQLKSIKEVSELPYLLSLDVSQNQLEESEVLGDPEKLKYLQIANFSQNQIKEVPYIALESLFSLNLSSNLIASAAKFTGHPKLKILELRKNKLVNFEGIKNMPCLEELYAAENEIVSLQGLENLPSLKRLHIRKNPIIKLNYFPTLPALEYLNLRETQIETMEEVAKLVRFNILKVLNLLGTPVTDSAAQGMKKEVLIVLDVLRLKKINKEEVTAEDIKEAAEEKKERQRQEEEAKREAERLAKEKEEQEAKEKEEQEAKQEEQEA